MEKSKKLFSTVGGFFMVTAKHQEDVAVFFDYENIVFSLKNLTGQKVNFEFLITRCQEYGRVVLANAYADWGNYDFMVAPIKSSGFDPIHVTTFAYSKKNGKKTRKNAVDIHMAIDAVDILHTQPQIDIYVLITGDKDFVPVAKMLRKYGKKVYAFGVKGTSAAHMQQAVDDFVFYADLESDGWKKKNVYEVLIEVVKNLNKENLRPIFPRVKDGLSEFITDFDEKNYNDRSGKPFSRFKDFILEAETLGYVKFITRDMVNEVFLPDAQVESQTQLPPLMGLDKAFALLVKAVQAGESAGKSLRSSSVKNTMRRMHPGFDEKEIKNENDKYFTNFSDFAREARKRGLVELSGKGIYLEIQPAKPQIVTETSPTDRGVEAILNLSEDRVVEAVPEVVDQVGQLAPLDPERAVIVAALRSQTGPAPAQDFGTTCQQLRDKRQINLPNRRISQLLTEANQAGIIRQSDGSPSKFVFVDDPDRIAQFMTGES